MYTNLATFTLFQVAIMPRYLMFHALFLYYQLKISQLSRVGLRLQKERLMLKSTLSDLIFPLAKDFHLSEHCHKCD